MDNAEKDDAVVALGEDARQVCGESIDSHYKARPRRIPQEEQRQATEHAPVGPFGTACFDQKLRKIEGIPG